MRERNDQAELDFDTKGERFNVITDKPLKSLFDCCDDVDELQPEPLKKPVKWMRCGDTEFFVETK